MDQRIVADCPVLLRDFLFYMETIKGRSSRTVEAYYIDLRTFLRFLAIKKGLYPTGTDPDAIKIADLPEELLKSATLSDAYEFLNYTITERGNNAKTRARKVSALRSFYKYLTNKAGILKEDPLKDLEVPALKKTLPKYLTLEECQELLTHVQSKYPERDLCILILFLNCGMRLSELVGIDLSDISTTQDHGTTLRLTGKGNKERIVYLNQACIQAIEQYLPTRKTVPHGKDRDALFLSSRGTRITPRRVEQIVTQMLMLAGLDGKGYSVHKLRHTAATLMYQNGVDIRILQTMLGHVNLGTTEIYTHISDSQLEQASSLSPLARMVPKLKKRDD